MEHTENAQKGSSFEEFVAIVLRGGRLVIALTLVCAILMGVYGAVWYYVLADDPDESYRVDLEEYTLTKLNLETAIEHTQKDLENQQNYNRDSLIMRIDPYNKHTTTMLFAISGVDASSVGDSFTALETPVSYMTSRILAQYLSIWNGKDLADFATGTQYEGTHNKYLGEIIRLTLDEGGVMKLNIIGVSKEDNEKVANAVYAFLLDSKKLVEQASYTHSITILSDLITSVSVDLDLERLQMQNLDQLEEHNMKVVEYQKSLLNLKAPSYSGGTKGIVIKTAVGALVGLALACLWLVGKQLVRPRITGERNLAAVLGAPCFGILYRQESLLGKMARKLLKDRKWSSPEQALSYIRESAAAYLPGESRVAVISTLAEVEEKDQEALVCNLGVNGCRIQLGLDAMHNPEAVAAMRQCDGIVLAERAYTTEAEKLAEVAELAKTMDKPIRGFVLV